MDKKPEFHLLILFQGSAAEDYSKKTKEYFSNIDIVGYQLIFKFISDWPAGVGNSVLDQFYTGVHWADAAIAIIAEDQRYASQNAGNIYFEMGWWMAKKSHDTLFVYAEETELVIPPTDLIGQVIPRFSKGNIGEKYEDLRGKIERTILSNKKITSGYLFDNNYLYKNELKIRDTIGNGEWEPVKTFYCENFSDPSNDLDRFKCSFRKVSVSLISEMYRMAENHKLCSEIISSFQEIAMCCEIMSTSEGLKGSKEYAWVLRADRARQDAFVKLRKSIGVLESIMTNYITVSVRKDVQIDNPWKKLKRFLEYRLETAQYIFENVNKRNTMSQELKHLYALFKEKFETTEFNTNKDNLDSFINIIQDIRNDNQYTSSEYYQQGTHKEMQNNIFLCKQFCRYLKLLLTFFNSHFYDYWYSAFSLTDSKSKQPLEDLQKTFNSIIDKIPQNNFNYYIESDNRKPKFYFPHIWPEPYEVKNG